MNSIKFNANEFLQRNKKLMMVVPIIIIVLIFSSFLLFKDEEKKQPKDKLSSVDMTLPSSSSKDTLPESKLETFEQYDQYTQEKEKNEQKGMSTGLPTDEKPRDNQVVYQQPNDEVAQKINIMLTKLNKQKKTQRSNQPSSNGYKSERYENSDTNLSKRESIGQEHSAQTNTNNGDSSPKESGFFGNKKQSKMLDDLSIYACVHTNQIVMNNQRVKLRSTKEFIYNGQKYPVNTIIYGLAQIKPNRLLIKINKINQTDIKLEVYDSEDSEQGLYVITPNLNESLQKELKREGIEDDDLRSIPFSKSLKNIFEKKVREEKVQLINNYKVLIKIIKDE